MAYLTQLQNNRLKMKKAQTGKTRKLVPGRTGDESSVKVFNS
jgi:hypothetical protein